MRKVFIIRSFQSTPSVRRATKTVGRRALLLRISIHALREESDVFWTKRSACARTFQSTPSVRRATHVEIIDRWDVYISIHALREESDQEAGLRGKLPGDFNPRPP